MEYLGLFIEIIFLFIGVYVYLFARGVLKVKNPDTQKRAETFRVKNARWLRIVGLALFAIMAVNIYMHIKQLFFM